MNPDLPLLTQFRREKSNIHNAFGIRTKVVRFSGSFKVMGLLEAAFWGKNDETFGNIYNNGRICTDWHHSLFRR